VIRNCEFQVLPFRIAPKIYECSTSGDTYIQVYMTRILILLNDSGYLKRNTSTRETEHISAFLGLSSTYYTVTYFEGVTTDGVWIAELD
jgi:hypothetical protein